MKETKGIKVVMFQRARAEKSEVQNLIYGEANTNQKNYQRQNYEEIKQIQRETQQRIQQNANQLEKNWKLRKFRDVKPKLSKTGVLNDENYTDANANHAQISRSRTQDKKNRIDETNIKIIKENKSQSNKPLKEMDNNKIKVAPKKKSALQRAGQDMVNSSKQSFKVGANNPPPLEQPSVVYYTPESKEDIHSLIPRIDPVQAHRERYNPRNIQVPKIKKPVKPTSNDEVMISRKEGIPADKGYIAPKRDKNFIKK